MIVFHRTTAVGARSIVEGGFRDTTGRYGTDHEFTGVWVSTRPLDANEGTRGDALFSIEIPDALFEEHEWVEVEKTNYREALIPAEKLNQYGPPTLEMGSMR